MINKNDNRWIDKLPMNTEIQRYLTRIKENYISTDMDLSHDKTDEIKGESLFLSVIIRTQGKREGGLRESLLCLSAQTFSNYEIILIIHKAGTEEKKLVRNIVNEQQEDLINKIRIVELDEGTRTRPLNVGFSLARGKYAAVFDDDDILFDTWIESFYELAKENDGRILHTYAFSQDWDILNDNWYRALGAPKSIYCVDFDLLNQMFSNKCPLMTLAFPLYPFRELGIVFNEELEIMEDWDYFMRLAFICGVSDLDVPTAIYRFWRNAESSATLYDKDEWTRVYEKIRDGQGRVGMLIPKEYSKRAIEMLPTKWTDQSKKASDNNAKLYFSCGEPFSEDKVTAVPVDSVDADGHQYNYWFSIKYPSKKLSAFRFDFGAEGLFLLKSICIEIYYANGECRKIPLKECAYTGLDFFGELLFLHNYPSIVWEHEKEDYIECIHVAFEISREFWNVSKKYILFEKLFSLRHLKNNKKMHNKNLF